MTVSMSLVYAMVSMTLITLVVCAFLIVRRIDEMRREHIHPQSIAVAHARSLKLKDSRASDNYNHLFEMPVLFYVLCSLALILDTVPVWLTWGAWGFVLLRLVHSYVQCTYNKVMHRFSLFLVSYILLGALWVAFAISYGLTAL